MNTLEMMVIRQCIQCLRQRSQQDGGLRLTTTGMRPTDNGGATSALVAMVHNASFSGSDAAGGRSAGSDS